MLIFQHQLPDFFILANTNTLTENSDFGAIWENFFQKGGYDPILPYATDPCPINLWHDNLYLQGFFATDVPNPPTGYELHAFEASDFLVIASDWMDSSEQAVTEGNQLCNEFAENPPIPDGYQRSTSFIKLERENLDTPIGSRYEVWIPIEKIC